MTAEKARTPAQAIAETLDRLIDESERDKRGSFAALVRAAGLDPAHDFIGAFLADLDFRDEDLRGFDFSGADLTGADFRRANIAGVRFEGAVLTGAIGLRRPTLHLSLELPPKGERKMARAERSGRRLSAADASLVKGMLGRGDRHHDIAAWFGVNQGRIAEVKAGELHPEAAPASPEELPPQGSPGRIAKIAIQALDDIKAALETRERVQHVQRILELAFEQIHEER